MFSPIVGLYTCIKILDRTFLETYPLHVRRKQFFEARQKEGIETRERRREKKDVREKIKNHEEGGVGYLRKSDLPVHENLVTKVRRGARHTRHCPGQNHPVFSNREIR